MSEIRDGETITAFTMRRVRDEIIEECALAVEAEYLNSETEHPEDKSYDQAIRDAAEAVRVLKSSSQSIGQ